MLFTRLVPDCGFSIPVDPDFYHDHRNSHKLRARPRASGRRRDALGGAARRSASMGWVRAGPAGAGLFD